VEINKTTGSVGLKIKLKKLQYMSRVFYYMLLCILLLTGVNTGCVQEEKPIGPTPSPASKETITLYFRDASRRPATRALDDSLESVVKTIDVLAFKLAYSQLEFAYHVPVNESDMRSSANDYTKKEFAITVEKDNELYRYVLLANARKEVAAYMASGAHKGELKSIFLSEIISENTDLWNTNTNSPNYRCIPMCGESDGEKTVEQLNGKEIALYRSLVRVDVKVDAGVPFELEEIYVYNRPSRGRIAPDPNLWSSEQKRFIAPSLPNILEFKNPAGNAPVDASYPVVGNASTGYSSVHEIYLYETKEQDTQHFINATFLVLGGIYNGQKNYYRVDFAEVPDTPSNPSLPGDWWEQGPPSSGTGDGGMVGAGDIYYPLIRNHHYEMSITGVQGSGASSAAEASKSITSRLSAELLTWDNQNENVIIDNDTYTLTVKPSELTITREQSGTVTFATDYPNPTWRLSEPSVDWLQCTLEGNKIKVEYKKSAVLPPQGTEGYFRLRLMNGNTLKVSQQIKVVFN
jgi:hypothetical protein